MKIDPETGELAATGQDDAIFEYFLEEYAPRPRDRAGAPTDGEREIKPEDLSSRIQSGHCQPRRARTHREQGSLSGRPDVRQRRCGEWDCRTGCRHLLSSG